MNQRFVWSLNKLAEMQVFVLVAWALIVGDAGAANYSQVATLHSFSPPSYERFGEGVAISSSRVFVGGPTYLSGSVGVFQENPTGNWEAVASLHSSSSAVFDFGESIAVEGTTLIVGAPGKNSPFPVMGAAYVFEQAANGQWNQTAELLASDSLAWRRFGNSVSIEGSIALVGAPGAAGLPVSGAHTGAAYLFARDGNGQWMQKAKFAADVAKPEDTFAYSTALAGGTAFVADPGEYLGGTSFGSVRVYNANAAGEWVQTQKLHADDPTAGFGDRIAADDRTLVVAGTISIGDGYGLSAFVFHKNSANEWQQTAMILPPDPEETAFGSSIAVENGTVVIGDRDFGLAHVFVEQDDFSWQLIATLEQNHPERKYSEDFGSAVAMNAGTIVVGAASDGAANAAYVFQVPEPNSASLICVLVFAVWSRRRALPARRISDSPICG